jgi:competence/damage-inducible protein CinA-like protein
MPTIELLTIGTELLLGFTLDTNSAEIGRALSEAGLAVVRRTTVGDDPAAIRAAFDDALGRTGLVLATGGLGPTSDDVTKKVVADLFGMPLEFVPEIWEQLLARFARLGRKPAAANRGQAEVPVGATVLPNRWGTAPGLWLEGPRGIAILLPGVPGEMRKLLHHEVLPRLATRAGSAVIRSRAVRTWGLPESSVAEKIADLEAGLPPLSLAFLPGTSGVDLRLTAWNLEPGDADARLGRAIALLRSRLGDRVYGENDDDLAALLLQRLREPGLSLATAESCTGGLLGARLTEIPGSSEVYLGGVVAYDNAVKIQELGVPPALVDAHGAVSDPVVRAMSAGILERLGADAAIAITGIAGPGGGTPEKPVGLVFVAATAGNTTSSARYMLPGTRREIRERAAQAALFQLWSMLDGADPGA